MGSPKIELYDVSPKMREILEFKEKRRLELRQEYLRQYLNPVKQQLLVDSAVDRFTNMRNLHDYRLKTDVRRYGMCCFILFGSVLFFGHMFKVSAMEEEKKIRSGLVAYADRKSKFI